MYKKEIANIVFYTLPNETGFTKKATIFLMDGTVRTVSFEEGIDACEEIVKERNIQTKDAFKEMINHDIVHVTTAEDFKNRFEEFIPVIQPIEENEEERLNAAIVNPSYGHEDEVEEEPTNQFEDVYSYSSPEERDFLSDDLDNENNTDIDEENEDELIPEEEEDLEEENIPEAEAVESEEDSYDDYDEYEDDYDDDYIEEKEGFFKRAWNKIKNSTGVKVVVACVTALAIGLGIASCAKRQSKEGVMANSNLSSISTTSNKNSDDDSIIVLKEGKSYTQDSFADDTEIKTLLDKTKNETQKTAMVNTGNAMDGFNNVFAYQSREKGSSIRPSLKFEEVMALQVAYNDYSREQLVSIFNGADIKSGDLSRAYKDANLQLMGAYAMESPKHPVDMSMLIDSQEGKDFYKKYHDAFLAIKKAKDEDKTAYANKFYKMVRKDFPVTEKVRTEGISHAENYESITSYKLAVAPMIAAAEMMWQNLKTDVTLKDMEVDFINDLGLCNYADKAFARAELLSLSNPVDITNPTYEEYKEAFIKFYKDHKIYYIDDAHRELTKLKAFQNAVNWHFKKDLGTGTKTTTGGSKTSTRTTTKTYTKTSTTTHEETTRRNVPVTPEARRQVDDDLDKENEQARTAAEQEAERNRQRMQEEEDRHAEEVEREVQRDAEDLQNNINNANEQINRNNADDDRSNDVPVNENDLGHGVKFDDEHSDGNGNLNSSVSNITTDSTGDKTNEPLPDPNETGREFDARANSSSSSRQSSSNSTSSRTSTSTSTNTSTNTSQSTNNNKDQWVESTPVADDYYYENAWVEYEDDNDYSSAVNSYVESMANSGSEDSNGYSYHK